MNKDNQFSLGHADYGVFLKVEKISKKLEVKDIKIELKVVCKKQITLTTFQQGINTWN